MKNKLKLLFAYFRPFRFNNLYTYINFIYDDIEEWDKTFHNTTNKVKIKPPEPFIQIIEDLINYKMKEFHKYNEYDFDEYWTLIVNIYPNENRINFTSECKIQHEEAYKFEYNLESSEEMSRSGDEPKLVTAKTWLLDEINKTLENEIDDEDTLVTFDFDGSYDEIYVEDVRVDNDRYEVRKHPWVDLLDRIMRWFVDRWWNEGPGNSGTVKIVRNESLIISGVFKSQDYDYTDMDINVIPDSFE